MLNSLVLSVTYQCPIKCKYCGENCGPHRKERMSIEFIRNMIDKVSQLSICKLVVFTGGEPLLLGNDLFSAIKYATEKGFISRIVTNAYWANTKENTYRTLLKLKECGLVEINFSCDDFHQEFIPLENIKLANEIANQLQIPALIVAKGIKHSIITKEYLENFLGIKLTTFKPGKDNPKNNVITYGVTVPVGWDSERLNKDDIRYPENIHAWKIPCDDILKNIVITPDGKFSACCGCGSEGIAELTINDIYSKSLIELITEGNDNLIWNWLALEGPYGIMEFIKKSDPSIQFEEKYVNKCHLCTSIFSNEEIKNALMNNMEKAYYHIILKRAWLELNRDKFNKNNKMDM